MADHNIVKNIRMTPEELQAIQKKMELFGTTNFSAAAFPSSSASAEIPKNTKKTKIKAKKSNKKSVQASCTHTEEKARALWTRSYSSPAADAGFPVVL